jgi:hypothetical protein
VVKVLTRVHLKISKKVDFHSEYCLARGRYTNTSNEHLLVCQKILHLNTQMIKLMSYCLTKSSIALDKSA